ncbi:MAG: hypothetical protein QOG81_1950, partial [Gaiellaceae bacterium]|nr:hypothetical protein [Gaiellaceae bacterium]
RRALHEPLAHRLLQRGDLVADRRLDVSELERGGAEGPASGDCPQRDEVT